MIDKNMSKKISFIIFCIFIDILSIILSPPSVSSSFHPFNQWPLVAKPFQEYYCESRIEIVSHLICCRKLCYDSGEKKTLTTYHINCKTRINVNETRRRYPDESYLVKDQDKGNNVSIDCNKKDAENIRNKYELPPKYYILRGENARKDEASDGDEGADNRNKTRLPSPLTENEIIKYQKEFNCTIKGFNERKYFEKR